MLQKFLVVSIFLVGMASGGFLGFNVGKTTSFIEGYMSAIKSDFCSDVIPLEPLHTGPRFPQDSNGGPH